MEANELMIGDWVGRVFDDRRIIEDYRQVDWIRTGEIGMRYQKVWSIGCIEPIPLSAEILEKNLEKECEDKIDYGLYFNVEDSKVWGILDEDGFWLNFNGQQDMILIHYVHELQHALRLCGLNKFADNFKV